MYNKISNDNSNKMDINIKVLWRRIKKNLVINFFFKKKKGKKGKRKKKKKKKKLFFN